MSGLVTLAGMTGRGSLPAGPAFDSPGQSRSKRQRLDFQGPNTDVDVRRRGRARVTRPALVQALSELQKQRGRFKKSMHGLWRFDTGRGLTIEMGQAESTVEGAVVISDGATEIDAQVMKTLHQAIPEGDDLEVEGEWRSLRVGKLRIGPALLDIDEREQLSSKMGDAALLQRTTGMTPVERTAVGLEEEYGEMTRRLDAAVKQAIIYLGPFGIEEVELWRFMLSEARRHQV